MTIAPASVGVSNRELPEPVIRLYEMASLDHQRIQDLTSSKIPEPQTPVIDAVTIRVPGHDSEHTSTVSPSGR